MRYIFVGKTGEIPSGAMKVVNDIDRVPLCVINLKGEFYAVSGVCAHNGGFLGDGEIEGQYIKCPWHKAAFRIRDGKNGWPAPRPLRVYPLKIEKGSLYIGVSNSRSKEKKLMQNQKEDL